MKINKNLFAFAIIGVLLIIFSFRDNSVSKFDYSNMIAALIPKHKVKITITNGQDVWGESVFYAEASKVKKDWYEASISTFGIGRNFVLDENSLTCQGDYTFSGVMHNFWLQDEYQQIVFGDVKSDVTCEVKVRERESITPDDERGVPSKVFVNAANGATVNSSYTLYNQDGKIINKENFDYVNDTLRAKVKITSLKDASGNNIDLSSKEIICLRDADIDFMHVKIARKGNEFEFDIDNNLTNYFCTIATEKSEVIKINMEINNGSFKGIGDAKNRVITVDGNTTTTHTIDTVADSDGHIANEGTVTCDGLTRVTYTGGVFTIASKNKDDSCVLTLKENSDLQYSLKLTVKNGIPTEFKKDNIPHGESFGIAHYFQANRGYQAEDAKIKCTKVGESQSNDKGYDSVKIHKSPIERSINLSFVKITSSLECELSFVKDSSGGSGGNSKKDFALNFEIINGTIIDLDTGMDKRAFSMKIPANSVTHLGVNPDPGYTHKNPIIACPSVVKYNSELAEVVVSGTLTKEEKCRIEFVIDTGEDEPGLTDEQICFEGQESLYMKYQIELNQDEFKDKCCKLSSAIDHMGKEKYLKICTSCFNGSDSILEKYKKDPEENRNDLKTCCFEEDAVNQMGETIYNDVCDTCFDGPNSLKEQYALEPNKYEEKYQNCCSRSNALDKMGNVVYNRLCQKESSCNTLTKYPVCQGESDSGYIYEANEKGITKDNISCIIADGKYFEEKSFTNNKYCSVYCKEDIDYYFPGFGYNPKSEYAIPSGGNFSFKEYQENGMTYPNLPTFKQTKTCVYVMDNKSLFKDLYDLDKVGNINVNNIKGGLYKKALDILNEYKETKENNNTGELIKLEKEYKEIATQINNALGEYRSCLNYQNVYLESDLPKIENFHYQDMKLDPSISSEIFKKINLVIKEKDITPTTEKEYCTDSFVCNSKPQPFTFPSLSTNISNLDINAVEFINSHKATTTLETFEFAKDSAGIMINYGPNVELYSIKPSGKVVTQEDLPQKVKNNNQFNSLGYGFPINLRARAGKYSYEFDITKLGINNRLLEIYVKEVGNKKYECDYFIKNEIYCSADRCYTAACLDDGTCAMLTPGLMEEIKTALISRIIDINNIKLDHRELGRNWTDNKGSNAIDKIVRDGQDIYLGQPMYSFSLSGENIKEIKGYNKTTNYNDFNLVCDEDGNRCLSDFVTTYGGDNINQSRSKWIEYDEENEIFSNQQ